MDSRSVSTFCQDPLILQQPFFFFFLQLGRQELLESDWHQQELQISLAGSERRRVQAGGNREEGCFLGRRIPPPPCFSGNAGEGGGLGPGSLHLAGQEDVAGLRAGQGITSGPPTAPRLFLAHAGQRSLALWLVLCGSVMPAQATLLPCCFPCQLD